MEPTASSQNQRKWRNFLIRAPIQLRITTYNLIFLYLMIGWVVLTILVPVYQGVQDPSNLYTQHYSAKFFLMLLERITWLMGAVFFLGLTHQVVITHRFCGPLVNFSHTWSQVRDGDLTRRVHLRQRDFFKEEAAELNAMVDGLNERLASVTQCHHRTLSLIRELDAQGPQGKPLAPDVWAEIKSAAMTTQIELDRFTLASPPQAHNHWAEISKP